MNKHPLIILFHIGLSQLSHPIVIGHTLRDQLLNLTQLCLVKYSVPVVLTDRVEVLDIRIRQLLYAVYVGANKPNHHSAICLQLQLFLMWLVDCLNHFRLNHLLLFFFSHLYVLFSHFWYAWRKFQCSFVIAYVRI